MSVSDMTSPSLNQKFGYTAAMPAASSPTRAPATRRPAMPVIATAAAPSTHDHSWWARNDRSPTSDAAASTMM
jgi:hypothetical protein